MVAAGHVTALRLFDLAYAIDLGRAETLWASQARQGARSRLTGTPPKAVSFGDPPLGLVLPPIRLALGEAGETEAAVTARLYAFGVVTLAVQVPAHGLAWDAFSARVNAVNAAIGPETDIAFWHGLLDVLRGPIGPALTRPNRSDLEEDFLVATVHAFAAPVAAGARGPA